MMASMQKIARMALTGGAVGILYGLSNLSLMGSSAGPDAVGFGQYIVDNCVSLTHYNLPAASLMNLIVLFLLVIQAGGVMAEALHTMAPYRLTRKNGRVGLYCGQALYLAIIASAYCALYALAFALTQAVAGGYGVSAGDWKAICAALCAHLIPGALTVVLWANFLSCKIGRANACVCAAGACALLLFALPTGEEYNWLAALNPMMNISPSWQEWFAGGGQMEYGAHSLIYWTALLCATLICQTVSFKRSDIL